MQTAQLPIATLCHDPAVDAEIYSLILDLAGTGLTIRQATEAAARKVAAAAEAKRWRGDLVDFVVIRTADLGARLARAS